MIQPHRIFRHAYGSFDHRHTIEPMSWPHFDILWIHRGALSLTLAGVAHRIEAPGGVLIAPGTLFSGRAISDFAVASVCHFEGQGGLQSPFLAHDPENAGAIQPMLDLLGRYVGSSAPEAKQLGLLHSIIAAFEPLGAAQVLPARLTQGWQMAAESLERVRSLTDVANAIGMSESGFRALHRSHFDTSAGQYLLTMRMEHAARRLATSRDRIADIAKAVGYAYPESFSQSFHKYFGVNPRAYRNAADRFA